MLPLVPQGPEIPNQVIQELEKSRLVFFCGAGISRYTGIPLFHGLCEEIWKQFGHRITDKEDVKELFDKEQYDKFLYVMEKRVSRAVRESVAKICSSSFTGDLVLHKALLQLGRVSDSGIRLITTNFDNRFLETGLIEAADIHSAPALPPPNLSWHSLVHLHGRTNNSQDRMNENLVFSSADFGAAYLTDAWASRFVTQIFRDFTIVFVGYSLADPIMTYLVDAIAAARESGGSFKEPFAFASFSSLGDTETTRRRWKAKGVTPILYHDLDNHRLLETTLVKLAELKHKGVAYKYQILEDFGNSVPSTLLPEEKTQMLWSLSDEKVAAKLPEKGKQFRLEWFLDMIAVETAGKFAPGYEGRTLLEAPDSTSRTHHLTGPRHSFSYLPPNTRSIARWLCSYLDDNRLIEWAVSKNCLLHPDFKQLIQENLRSNTSVSSFQRLFWTLITDPTYNPEPFCQSYPILPDELLSDQHKFKKLFVPILVFAPKGGHPLGNDGASEKGFREFCNPRIALSGRRLLKLNENLFANNNHELLAKISTSLTEYLCCAMEMLQSVGEASKKADLSWFELNSIEPSLQDKSPNDLAILIQIVRNSFNAAMGLDPELAHDLFRKWTKIDFPIFSRLILYAAAKYEELPIGTALERILEGDCLWSIETHKELLAFLRIAGNRLSTLELQTLCEAIQRGPNAGEPIDESHSGAVRLRFHKLSQSGANLSEDILKKAGIFGTNNLDEPNEYGEFENEFLIYSEIITDWDHSSGNQNHISQLKMNSEALYQALTSSPDDVDTTLAWQELIGENPTEARKICQKLIANLQWVESIWLTVFKSTGENNDIVYIESVLEAIELMNDEILNKLIRPACRWLAALGCKTSNEKLLFKAIERLWTLTTAEDLTSSVSAEPVMESINSPAGNLAEALIDNISRNLPENEPKKIPSELRPLLEKMCGKTSEHELLASTIFASRLPILFKLDRDWTQVHLCDHMDWSNAELSKRLWAGYLWSPWAFPDLAVSIGPSLLKTLRRDEISGDTGRNACKLAVNFLMNNMFDSKDLACVLTDLDTEKRCAILAQFTNHLLKVDQWKWTKDVKSKFSEVWPADKCLQNVETTTALSQMAIAADEEFPDAVDTIATYLVGGESYDQVLYSIDKSQLPEKFPATCIILMTLLLDGSSPNWNKELFLRVVARIPKSTAGYESTKFKKIREVFGE